MTKDLAMLAMGKNLDTIQKEDYLNTEAFMESIDAHFCAEWGKIMS